MTGKDYVGLGFGVAGIVACFIGLFIGITAAVQGPYFLGEELLFTHPLAVAYEMICYLAGAMLLVVSAALAGKGARLLLVQELLLTLFGIIFFIPIAEEYKLVLRVGVLIGMVLTIHRLKLASDANAWTGVLGQESLGYGYLLNHTAGFALGGVLLSIYAYVRMKREGGWVNRLWLILNMPFAVVSAVKWGVQLSLGTQYVERGLGAWMTTEIFVFFGFMGFAAVVMYVGAFQPWHRLGGKPELYSMLAGDSFLTNFFEGSMPFWEAGLQGETISNRQLTLLEHDINLLRKMRSRHLRGKLTGEELEIYDRMATYIDRVCRFIVEERENVGLPVDPRIDDLLKTVPDHPDDKSRRINLVIVEPLDAKA